MSLDDRLVEVNKILAGCIYKYGPLINIDRTLQNVTLGFNTLYQYNDIYEHEYRIIHYFNSLEEQKALLKPPTAFNGQKKFIDELLKSIKVTCFSGIAVNNLMWSHYSDKHNGVCYCFDKNTLFEEKRFPWGKVKYSSSIPEVPIFQDHTTQGMLNAHLDIVILTKSLEWSYENEIRFFRCQEENYAHFIPLSLKAVIIGRRVADDEIDHIKEKIDFFNTHHNTKVKVLYAYRQPGSFSLGVDWEKSIRDGSEDAFGAQIPVRDDLDTPLITNNYKK